MHWLTFIALSKDICGAKCDKNASIHHFTSTKTLHSRLARLALNRSCTTPANAYDKIKVDHQLHMRRIKLPILHHATQSHNVAGLQTPSI